MLSIICEAIVCIFLSLATFNSIQNSRSTFNDIFITHIFKIIFIWIKIIIKMFRLYRCMRWHSLDKESMIKRSTCFYSANPASTYSQDTIRYSFNLTLHPGNSYEGVASINFKLKQKNNLFLDFSGKSIQKIIINTKQLSNPTQLHKQGKINLPPQLLHLNENQLCIKFQNQYDKDGNGCVSFVDVDNKQYLYTQFQPYMGNRVVPMFDQPNLKAKMELSIACPSQWETVLSNEHQIKNRNLAASPICHLTQKILSQFSIRLPSSYKITHFSPTKLLPTYLFCFVVGPYKKYESKNTYKNIPMSLYCIESLYPHMMNLVPFIEQMTNKSMQFFEKYFGYAYPFSKYDQVFAHEYKWGAMQNPGIVTLNDNYIFKDPVSVQKMISFGNTIVHEMAHHWFGNLVTMKWWDDLWLNESFAEYISHFCLQKIKSNVTTLKYQSAMVSFLNRKGWGYMEDQLQTTHPISSDVQNTKIAQTIFDGITYSKGAATMKQLMYLMGEEQFSSALKQYFKNFQFKNAELSDLLKYMSLHYKNSKEVTISSWREMWLEKASLNILSCEFDERRGMLLIKQSAYHKQHSTLRSHTIKIAIIQTPKSISQIQVTVKPVQLTEVTLSPEQLTQLKKCNAILLNHHDLTFAKVILDQKSIKYFKNHLNEIEDVLFRSMVWKNFYDMVKDGNLKTTQYVEILINNLFQQKSDTILQQNLNYAKAAIDQYTPLTHRSSCLNLLFDKCLKQTSNLSTNRTIIIKDKLILFCDTNNNDNIKLLQDWYYEHTIDIVNRFGKVNITDRWKIVIKVLSSKLVNNKYKKQLLEDMVKRDTSDIMKNKKQTCDGLLLPEQQVQQHFNKIVENNTQKVGMTSFIHLLSGINSKVHQQTIRSTLNQKYFNILSVVLSSKQHKYEILKNDQMAQLFLTYMDPNIQDTIEDLQHKIEQFSKIRAENHHKIRILKKIDLLQKRIKCFQLYK